MSRFNFVKRRAKTTNLAGGLAYEQSNEMELVSLLLTSFANDQFYRKADDTFEKLKSLIEKTDKAFVARAVIYARTKFGMRSISHVAASLLAEHIGGAEFAKNFYTAVVYRPDDMMEILAYHTSRGQKVTNAMKKGFAKAFDKFDKYQLAKYRGENKSFKLVDVINLVHPMPTEKNAEAISLLIKGDLKSFGTWESELTRAGQDAKSETQKEQLKANAWTTLIAERKIGYFALLRNLRNIVEQAPAITSKALEMLTDERLIRKSLVMPFRFLTAQKELSKISSKSLRNVIKAINEAAEISLSNVPVFEGKTLIVLDVSGSMTWGQNSNQNPAEIGAIFAMALYKTNNADFMTFDNEARFYSLNPADSLLSLTRQIRFTGGGTNFHSIFELLIEAGKSYDRVVLLSDMQGWMGYYTPEATYKSWKAKTRCEPFVYSFDLNSYGDMQFPEDKVFCLAGFSDKVFDIMKLLETDKSALINTIKKVEIG